MNSRGVTGGAAGRAGGWRRALHSIRVQMGLLIVALVLINGLVVGALIAIGYRTQTRRTELQLTETATALSLAVDGSVRETAGELKTLASSPRLQAGDVESFDRLARRTVEGPSRWVLLVDDQGRRLVDTAFPPGAPLPPFPPNLFQAYRRGVAGKAFHVSDLIPSSVTGRPKVGVMMPVPRPGRPTWHLGIALDPSVPQQIFAEQGLPPGWFGSLHDRQGRVIARSLHSSRYVGDLAPPEVLAHILHNTKGVFQERSLEGYSALTAFKRSNLTGWTLTVAMPRASATAALVRFLALTTALMLGLLLIGVALVWRVGGRFAGAIGGLAETAKALGRGAPIEPPITGLSEIDAVGSAMHEASDELREREGKIRRLVDSNIIGIALWTMDGRVTEANDALLAIWGFDRDDLLAGRIDWIELTPAEWSDATQRSVDELRATGRCEPFEKELFRKDGSRVPVLLGVAMFSEAPEEGVAFVLDLTEQKKAEQRLKLMVDELNHRVKNTLATVMAISARSLRSATSLEAFRRAFQGRLMALSETHNLLNETFWSGVTLRGLVEQTLAPYAAADRAVIAGEDVRLGPIAAVTLGMALYELADNAARYGALSTPSGQVQVSWRRSAPGRLQLDWVELGGPPVQPPSRRGFGSQLIEKALAAELRGEVRLEFPPQGVRCSMDMGLDQVSTH
jgi:PAS domain S-box-containing protein